MNTREEFEKWKERDFFPQDRNAISPLMAWQAATESSDAEWQARVDVLIDELKRSANSLHEEYLIRMKHRNTLLAERAVLASTQARVKELEEAGKAILDRLSPSGFAPVKPISHSEREMVAYCRVFSTTSPDKALQRVILDARIDEVGDAANLADDMIMYTGGDIAIQLGLREVELRKQRDEIGG